MSSILPPIPRFVFTVFEPLALAVGFLSAVLDTSNFISSQLPSITPNFPEPTAANRLLALQLGNVYGLLAMIGCGILYTTTEPKVVRNFLFACAVADVGHLLATYAVMGHESFLDVGQWSQTVWGSIGITAGLFVTRVLYLAGAMGKDRGATEAVKKNI